MRSFILINFLLFCLSANAQFQSFSFELKVLHKLASEDEQLVELESNETDVIFGIPVMSIQRNANITSRYSSSTGFEGSFYANFKLGSSLSLSTGLGLNYTSFLKTTGENVFFDAFNPSGVSLLNFGLEHCDEVVNQDLVFFQRTDDFKILNGRIPMMINYTLLDDFIISVGLNLQVPIYATNESFAPILEEEVSDNGFTTCTFQVVGSDDSANDFLNDLVSNGVLAVGYHLDESIRIRLGVQQTFDNVFSNTEAFQVGVHEVVENYLPTSYFASVEFVFGKK